MLQIIYHARIHTLDDKTPLAQAMVIFGEKIIAVGDNYTILAGYAKDNPFSQPAKLFDAGGKTILPGLVDAHLHLEHYSLGLQKVDCETASKAECLERVSRRAQQSQPGQWILGHGWNQNQWPEGFGTKAELDRVAPHNPVYLTAKSLHAAWANSPAFEAAGIDPSTPNPSGGTIQRAGDKTPGGILLESAMQLVEKAIPEVTLPELVMAIEQALPGLHRMGLTGLHNYDGARSFSALQILKSSGWLKMRVVQNILQQDLPGYVQAGIQTGFGDDSLRIGNLKLFADGALGPQTAAMLQAYDSSPDNLGMLMLDGEEIFEIGKAAVAHGIGLSIHAIGDRANHEVLTGLERIRKFEEGLHFIKKPLRHRIEHVQIIHPQDAPRLAQLGIIASMQPIHATSDMLMADRYWGSRSQNAYAWRTQLDHGAVLAFGSDAPVESPNPFLGLHAAVTRQRADGSPSPEGWYPVQKLSLLEAIRAYTVGAAFAAGLEDHLGMLRPGYLADLILLEPDPFEIPAHEIKDLVPSATMIGGEWVD